MDSSSNTQTFDLKLWAGFGCFAFIAFMLFPLFGVEYGMYEMRRFTQCEGRSEKDPGCTPGRFWPFFEKIRNAEQEKTNDSENSPSTTSTSSTSPTTSPSTGSNGTSASSSASFGSTSTLVIPSSTIPHMPKLGEEGSVCGGPERLPCMPGLACRREGNETTGVCRKVSDMDKKGKVQLP